MKKSVFSIFFALFGVSAHSSMLSLQILGINDFHGNLEPPSGSTGKIESIDAGGVEYLATHLNRLRLGQRYSITVSAGDLWGASPLTSALFQDEPTILAMNLLGLDINALGNHEFDKGIAPIFRLKNQDRARNYPGASFSFLTANTFLKNSENNLFPPYEIRQFGRINVAFIGLLLEGMAEVTTKKAIEEVWFSKEATTINKLVPKVLAEGANAIVILIHEGGFPSGGYNECPAISGPIVDIVNELSAAHVALVMSGHTHQAYNCVINNILVTSAASNGRVITDARLSFDETSKELIKVSVNNVIVDRTVAKEPEQTKLIDTFKAKAAPIANKVIGSISASFTKAPNDVGESTMGKLIADAQLAFFKSQGVEIALVNPGGIRTDLSYPESVVHEGDGNITYAEAYAVQPFGNNLITLDLSGFELRQILEEQFEGCGYYKTRMLQVSNGFSYVFDDNGLPCQKIVPGSIELNGLPLLNERLYRVVANNFLAEGGDGFKTFKNGAHRITEQPDLEALLAFFKDQTLLSPTLAPRIHRL